MRLDPELVEPLELLMEPMGGSLNLEDIPALRQGQEELLRSAKASLPPDESVIVEEALADNGNDKVPLRIYRPRVQVDLLPGLLWIHGGGYVMGSAMQDDSIMTELVKNVGCVVVSVDYRLAPETPYPGPLEDCYLALEWMIRNATWLKISASRIALGGASAGGGLAAALALLVRDRGELSVIYQVLMYPMIDDRNVAPASEEKPDTLVWSRENNRIGWQSYLGSLYGSDDIPHCAAPFRAENLAGLPPAFVAIGQLDLFLDENIDYSQRLMQAGISTELRIYPDAYHGFDGVAPAAGVSLRASRDRNCALIRAFGK